MSDRATELTKLFQDIEAEKKARERELETERELEAAKDRRRRKIVSLQCCIMAVEDHLAKLGSNPSDDSAWPKRAASKLAAAELEDLLLAIDGIVESWKSLGHEPGQLRLDLLWEACAASGNEHARSYVSSSWSPPAELLTTVRPSMVSNDSLGVVEAREAGACHAEWDAARSIGQPKLAGKQSDKLQLMRQEFAVAMAVNAGCGDSPIEQMMLMALMFWRNGAELEPLFAWPPDRVKLDDGLDPAQAVSSGYGSWMLFAQLKVERYTLDFAVAMVGVGKIAIECDGHAYHERTKEQAKHDRERDRRLQALGWSVMRFTGSEIYADAHKCVGEVVEMMGTLERRASDWQKSRDAEWERDRLTLGLAEAQ